MGQRAGQMKVLPVLLLLLLSHTDQGGTLGTSGASPGATGGLLYPYGRDVGDEATPREDDGMSPKIHLLETFSFYGHPHRVLYVNNNGVVSFGVGVPEFTPEPFPLTGHRPFVAPYWADVDTTVGGEVFYRQSRDPQLLARLAKDLAAAVAPSEPAPKPTWAFVATWHRVSYFGAASNKVNTFQAVLVTDRATSYVMLNYGDLQWTTGIANQGDAHTGLGGLPAQAGFNSGDDVHYYNIPGSRSPDVLLVGRRSNVGVPGRWIFRVDHFTATEAPPSPPETPPGPTEGPPSPLETPPGPTEGPPSPLETPPGPTQGPPGLTEGPLGPTQGPPGLTEGPPMTPKEEEEVYIC